MLDKTINTFLNSDNVFRSPPMSRTLSIAVYFGTDYKLLIASSPLVGGNSWHSTTNPGIYSRVSTVQEETSNNVLRSGWITFSSRVHLTETFHFISPMGCQRQDGSVTSFSIKMPILLVMWRSFPMATADDRAGYDGSVCIDDRNNIGEEGRKMNEANQYLFKYLSPQRPCCLFTVLPERPPQVGFRWLSSGGWWGMLDNRKTNDFPLWCVSPPTMGRMIDGEQNWLALMEWLVFVWYVSRSFYLAWIMFEMLWKDIYWILRRFSGIS